MIINRVDSTSLLMRIRSILRDLITNMNILRQNRTRLQFNMFLRPILIRRRFRRRTQFLKVLNNNQGNRRNIITNNRRLLIQVINNKRLNRLRISIQISRTRLQRSMNTRKRSNHLTINRILNNLLMDGTQVILHMLMRLSFLFHRKAPRINRYNNTTTRLQMFTSQRGYTNRKNRQHLDNPQFNRTTFSQHSTNLPSLLRHNSRLKPDFKRIIQIRPDLAPRIRISSMTINITNRQSTMHTINTNIMRFNRVLRRLSRLQISIIRSLIINRILRSSQNNRFTRMATTIRNRSVQRLILSRTHTRVNNNVNNISSISNSIKIFHLRSLSRLLRLTSYLCLMLRRFRDSISNNKYTAANRYNRTYNTNASNNSNTKCTTNLYHRAIQTSVVPKKQPTLNPEQYKLRLLLLLSFALRSFTAPQLS